MQNKFGLTVGLQALLIFCLTLSASAQEMSAQETSAEKLSAVDASKPKPIKTDKPAVHTTIGIQPAAEITTALPATSEKSEERTTSGGGVFKPSEDISEDFAVPFPVDI